MENEGILQHRTESVDVCQNCRCIPPAFNFWFVNMVLRKIPLYGGKVTVDPAVFFFRTSRALLSQLGKQICGNLRQI